MGEPRFSTTKVEQHLLHSENLNRVVKIDCYMPPSGEKLSLSQLLLVNDGQDLVKMGFENILDDLYETGSISEIFCVGIHCSTDRKNEYGTAKILDYKGRGAKAFLYTKFIFQELIPFLKTTYEIPSFREKSFAGFSLGGLCALDIVWNYPHEFRRVGVFSGSLWWRDVDQEVEDFDEDKHRIMHRQVREGEHADWIKFFFEVGTLDETMDRNNNGVIDAIDDTLGLIDELVKKGYHPQRDIHYLELADGRHDIPTWARAFPDFLKWGWGMNHEVDH
jgi:enterochelin esterase-like enzyme